MKRFFILIGILIYFLIGPRTVWAGQIAGSSASIINKTSYSLTNSTNDFYKKKKAIYNIFKKYNSPLINDVDSFMLACQKYNLDCYLLPSIAGLESTFGQAIYPSSNNPFGWGGGYIMFNNWSEGIETVAQGLRNNYLNKGAETIDDIGRIYSESPTWAIRVQYFIKEMENEEEKLQLFLAKNQVEL